MQNRVKSYYERMYEVFYIVKELELRVSKFISIIRVGSWVVRVCVQKLVLVVLLKLVFLVLVFDVEVFNLQCFLKVLGKNIGIRKKKRLKVYMIRLVMVRYLFIRIQWCGEMGFVGLVLCMFMFFEVFLWKFIFIYFMMVNKCWMLQKMGIRVCVGSDILLFLKVMFFVKIWQLRRNRWGVVVFKVFWLLCMKLLRMQFEGVMRLMLVVKRVYFWIQLLLVMILGGGFFVMGLKMVVFMKVRQSVVKVINVRFFSGISLFEVRVKMSVIMWICMMEKYFRRLWFFCCFFVFFCIYIESIICFDVVVYMCGIFKIFILLGYMNIVK